MSSGNVGEQSGLVSNEWARRAFVAAAMVGTLVMSAACGANEAPESTQPSAPVSAEPTTGPTTEAKPSQEVSPLLQECRDETGLEDAKGLCVGVAQKRAAQVISTFENSTTKIQYGYAENLDDGRGITAGRAGFCSGTGDMSMVVKKYEELKPGNALADKYLKPLKKINKEFVDNDYNSTDNVDGLDGLEDAWADAAESDKEFIAAQDAVVNELYLYPAITRAEALGIHSAVGHLIIFDTNIQHGEGDDPDGLPAILDEASKKFPKGASEADKLRIILQVRHDHLMDADDPDTKEEWRDSVSRVDDALTTILESDNPDLTKAMTWSVYGDEFKLKAV